MVLTIFGLEPVETKGQTCEVENLLQIGAQWHTEKIIAIALVARSQLWSPCGCMVNSCLQIVCNWLQSSSENVKMRGLFLALSRQSSKLYTEISHTSLFTLDQGSHFPVPLQSKIAERGESGKKNN